MGGPGYAGVDLDDVQVAVRVERFHVARERVATPADEKRRKLVVVERKVTGDLGVDILIAIHQPAGVREIAVRVDEAVEDQDAHRLAPLGVLGHLDAEVVRLEAAARPDPAAGCGYESGPAEHQKGERGGDDTLTARDAGQEEGQRHQEKDDRNAPDDRMRAEPGDEQEARCEGAHDAADGAGRGNPADGAARTGEIAQRELGDDGRNRAQERGGNEEDARDQDDDAKHDGPGVGQGDAQVVDEQDGDAGEAGDEEEQGEQAVRGPAGRPGGRRRSCPGSCRQGSRR